MKRYLTWISSEVSMLFASVESKIQPIVVHQIDEGVELSTLPFCSILLSITHKPIQYFCWIDNPSSLQTSVIKHCWPQYASSLLLISISSTVAMSPMQSWLLFWLSAHSLHLNTSWFAAWFSLTSGSYRLWHWMFQNFRSRCEHPVVCSAFTAAWLKISIFASSTTLCSRRQPLQTTLPLHLSKSNKWTKID